MITLNEEQHAKLKLAQSSLNYFCNKEFVEDTKPVIDANDLINSVLTKDEDEEEYSPKKRKRETAMTEQNPMENPPETTININELEAMKESIVIIEKQFNLLTPNKEVHNSFRTIKNTLKEKLNELVVIENNLKKKKKISLTISQIDIMESIKEKMNLNLVNCGECGQPFFHTTLRDYGIENDEFFTCPHCLIESDCSLCSDVFYRGMNVDGEQVK